MWRNLREKRIKIFRMYHLIRRIVISYVWGNTLGSIVRVRRDSYIVGGNLNNRLLMSYYYYEYNKVMNEYVFSHSLARRGAKEMKKKRRRRWKVSRNVLAAHSPLARIYSRAYAYIMRYICVSCVAAAAY